MKRVAVIRLSSLGDIVHTLPAVALLKQADPGSRVSWFVEPPGDRLLHCFQCCDEVIPARLRGLGVAGVLKNAWRLKKKHGADFDVVLDFQGLIKSALFSRFFKGEHLGFHNQNLREPLAGRFYDRQAPLFDESQHVIYKNMHLLSTLGIDRRDVFYRPRKLDASPGLQDFLRQHQLTPGTWLTVNVGGGWPTKVLLPGKWREVVVGLENDFPIVVVWGNEQEKGWAEEICNRTLAAMAPPLDFGDLIWLIRHSLLIISCDTLPLHLADVLRIPSLGLFGPTAPGRNGSLLPQSVSLRAEIGCGFCYRRKCDTIGCMRALSASTIAETARRMAKTNG